MRLVFHPKRAPRAGNEPQDTRPHGRSRILRMNTSVIWFTSRDLVALSIQVHPAEARAANRRPEGAATN